MKGLIRPRGASIIHGGFAFIPKHGLTAFLGLGSGVRAGDRLEDAFGNYYKVETVEKESWLDKLSHYVCSLTQLFNSPNNRLTGLWDIDSSKLVKDVRNRTKVWLDAYLASIAKDQPPGCVLALPMNEAAGTITYDHSGNGYNGTLANGPAWVAGKYSGGLDFDGGNDYVNVGQHPTLNSVVLRDAGIIDSAVWCWFGDPRAVYYNGNTYIGYLTADKDVKISQYNHATKNITHTVLYDNFSIDDHANPSVIIRSDGKILVMWSDHGGNAICYRVSTAAENISAFGASQYIGYNIANPHIMRKENAYFMIIRGTDQRVWVRMTIGGVQKNVYSTDPINLDENVHLAATYDGVDIRIYVNGVLNCVPEVVAGAPTANAAAIVIGSEDSVGYDGNNWDGFIDELLVYDRAKGAAEILDDKNGVALNLTDCVLYLPCDEEGGDTLFDFSGEGNDATAHLTEVVAGAVGLARDYNGANSYTAVPHDASLNLSAITLEAWVHASFAAVTGTSEAPYTYSHLVQLDNGDTWVFYRGTGGVYYRVSADDGNSWGAATLLFTSINYFKEVTDGEKIYIACNDGHPDFSSGYLYYLEYDSNDSRWYKKDGTLIGDTGDMPFVVADLELLSATRSWIWDIALDGSGYPAIAYVRFDSATDHVYYYMVWTGTAWLDNEVLDGGSLGIGHLEMGGSDNAQPSYSSGIALDHSDPSIAYVSSTYLTGKFEIYKCETDDNGRTWTTTQLTTRCADKAVNMRPIVVRDHVDDLVALWLYGHYNYYTSHDMMLRSYPEIDVARTHNVGYTPLTVAAWVYPETDATTGNRHFVRRGYAYGLFMQHVTLDSAGFVETLDTRKIIYGDSLTLNSWNHIALTYDGVYLRIYLNKVLTYWQCVAGVLTGESGTNLYLGSFFGANSDNTLDGRIDETYVCNEALSEAEIERLADGTRYVNSTVMFHDSNHFADHIFLDKHVDGLVTVEATASTPLYTNDHYIYGFDETLVIHCYAINKEDISAVNLCSMLDQEIRRMTTVYPFGSIRNIDTTDYAWTDIGGIQLWETRVTIRYKRANPDYTPSYPTITWGPSAGGEGSGTFIFPNVLGIKRRIVDEDVWLHPPGFSGALPQAMGTGPFEWEFTCDLDAEPSALSWKRSTDVEKGDVFGDIKHNEGLGQLYHTLSFSASGPVVKVRIEKFEPVLAAEGNIINLLFREYTTSSFTGTYKARLGE